MDETMERESPHHLHAAGHPSLARVAISVSLAMLAFASNSLLCRLALRDTALDAASFTTVRLLSGAVALFLIVQLRNRGRRLLGSWRSAGALFAYAAGFSFAYRSLTAATGALILFGAVQATMIGHGLAKGERLSGSQSFGLLLALGGLLYLLLPGLAAPPLIGSALMMAAGIAWGIYSLRGRGGGDPVQVTAGNFVRAAPLGLLLSAATIGRGSIDGVGVGYAVLSGALTSGVGYWIWYQALPSLKASHAATVQLSVPVLAALGGVVLLGESVTLRLALSSVAILGGIALVLVGRWKR